MRRLFLFILLASLAACQSTREKNEILVRDRFEKLKPLSTWKPTYCHVEAHLTQPALARYREMFPDEGAKLEQESWIYSWKARESLCQLTTLEESPLAKNHRSFLETAFCLLLQTHYVNSPFDELKISPDDIDTAKDDKVQIRTGLEKDLGLFLDPKTVAIDTRTKSRGTLRAVYSDREHQWLPEHLEEDLGKSRVVLDNFIYNDIPVGGRRMIKSFWISVGDQQVFQHTQITITDCQNF